MKNSWTEKLTRLPHSSPFFPPLKKYQKRRGLLRTVLSFIISLNKKLFLSYLWPPFHFCWNITKWKLVAQSCLTLCDPVEPARLLCPGKNTGVGCYSFLQRTVPTQGLNLGLSHCRQILYHLRHQESPNWMLLIPTRATLNPTFGWLW